MSEAIKEKSSGPGQRGRGGPRRGGRPNQDNAPKSDEAALVEKLVFVNRTAKVVKGGRRFSFSALVVVGDAKGKVGQGFGKANEVSDAIRKATEAARKSMVQIAIQKSSIPHEVFSEYCGGKVVLRPASPGTGVIAGGGVRAVLEAAGIKDVLTKSLGSSNPNNVVKATLRALQQLRTRDAIMEIRGLKTAKTP
ncbi:MAG: 30S ribosomal protein S5 [Verrucomicrobiae bacterium]|nr:30S ribosomal protein S5 [Verrucomicrobiae bacterium]